MAVYSIEFPSTAWAFVATKVLRCKVVTGKMLFMTFTGQYLKTNRFWPKHQQRTHFSLLKVHRNTNGLHQFRTAISQMDMASTWTVQTLIFRKQLPDAFYEGAPEWNTHEIGLENVRQWLELYVHRSNKMTYDNATEYNHFCCPSQCINYTCLLLICIQCQMARCVYGIHNTSFFSAWVHVLYVH